MHENYYSNYYFSLFFFFWMDLFFFSANRTQTSLKCTLSHKLSGMVYSSSRWVGGPLNLLKLSLKASICMKVCGRLTSFFFASSRERDGHINDKASSQCWKSDWRKYPFFSLKEFDWIKNVSWEKQRKKPFSLSVALTPFFLLSNSFFFFALRGTITTRSTERKWPEGYRLPWPKIQTVFFPSPLFF